MKTGGKGLQICVILLSAFISVSGWFCFYLERSKKKGSPVCGETVDSHSNRVERVVEMLGRMASQDLSQLSEKQQDYVEQQVGSVRPSDFFPSYVSDFETDGCHFILFAEATRLVRFPSAARVRLTSFLPNIDGGYFVIEQEFPVGWTDSTAGISVITNTSSDVGSVLVVTAESGLRQFYADSPVSLGKFFLIRLEDEAGRLALGRQVVGEGYSNYTLGPRDLEYYRLLEWKRLFEEWKTVDLLAGLVYLNATHMPSPQGGEACKIAEEVRAWVKKGDLSAKLMSHSNQWVRQYASIIIDAKP